MDKCYKCHSAQAEKLKGALHLDTREGVLKGGNTGPALIPGNIAKSLLIRAVRWEDEEVQMPPKQKLTDEQIADLTAWVKMGAPDPRTGAAKPAAKAKGMTVEEGRKFWAFRPPVKSAVPPVGDSRWPKNDIDRFILARLEASGLKPAPAAEKPVLIRRLYYDLIGLPPTPEQVDAFVTDSTPYEKVVDELLASPHFGERWGRHWLDVARFAESLTLRGFIMKEAWRYRDYVIDAFNSDMPYDRFVREQIAGDLLASSSLEERRRQVVGITFLTLGNNNLEEQDKKQLEMDVVDEQLDAVSRAFLAQTVTCARCHDHKFDPIPTRDYYALAGILFNSKMLQHENVSKWLETPLPIEPGREAELKKHEEAIAAIQARIKTEKVKTVAPAKAPVSATKGVLAVGDVKGVVVDDSQAEKVGEWQLSTYSGTYIGSGYSHDKNEGKGAKSLTFQPELRAGKYEVHFAYSPGTSRASNVPVTILSAEGEKTLTLNLKENPPIDGRFVSLGQFRFENNQGYVMVSNDGTNGHVTADAIIFVSVDRQEQDGIDVRKLEAELKKLQDSGPKREMVMTVKEAPKPVDVKVHVRGSVHNQAEVAPRGFLQVATIGKAPTLPADQSGRLQLGEWLSSRDNPLAARVMANRVWHWLFGAGIVRTTDNFGSTGELPSHPDLLDSLALRFSENWSVKGLIREVVLSNAYRMASVNPAKTGDADPENRLLWRMNRRRMDAESLRDTLLMVGGKIKLDRGGPTYPASLSADYGYKHADSRRSVYVPAFRNALPELFEVFDFADTSVVTGRRNSSTIAPQALFLMNDPFVLDQAKHAAARLLSEKHPDPITRAWRLALGRAPTEAERKIAQKASWTSIFHALFASVDFRYIN